MRGDNKAFPIFRRWSYYCTEAGGVAVPDSGRTYNFSNIRYAEPPVGDLRFRAPVPPQQVNRSVDQGLVGRVCPQAGPAWYIIASEFDPAYLAGKPFNASAAEAALAAANASPPFVDPRETEDCLFLDVVVPEQIFAQTQNSTSASKGAPVLVWIYGGGYTAGEKTGGGLYNPAGLIKASQVDGSDGVIYVAPNYRLGAFGWLAGPSVQSDGTANAGLYDQRLALQWVQDNIHLFGGDPNRVTVLGESAGGGSVMHQITAFAGLAGKAPFQQAVIQSPGFQPLPGNFQQEQAFDTFLSLLNVSTLAEARQMNSSALSKANVQQVAGSPYGLFSYGPVVDGLFVPALPGKLLLQGSFDHSLKLMLGHNADEGLTFTTPFVTNDTAHDEFVKSYVPDIDPSVAGYIEDQLYPTVSNSTLYTDETGRLSLLISELAFVCNTLYLDRAFGNETFAYQFSVPPALHGQDVPYTFFNGPSTDVLSDATAIALQEYVTSFALYPHILHPGNTLEYPSNIPRVDQAAMDDIPPSYEAAIRRDHWSIIAEYVRSSDDLCAASRVCKRWHQIYAPLLWGNPASHFGTENDRVYVALTRFKRSLKWVRYGVRSLTHTLHLPPAQAELYDGPHPGWLRDVLLKLPNLQSLVVSQLPFFDHASLLALRTPSTYNGEGEGNKQPSSFALRLLIATQCANTTQRSLGDALIAFPNLVFLDLSRTLGARDPKVLSKLRAMSSLQILKLSGIQLRDADVVILADAIGFKIRSLDVRDNFLTDNSVRTLLHWCLKTLDKPNHASASRPRGLSGAAEEDWPSGILKPDPAVLDEFRDESFDERYLKRLTQGLVSRMPSEDQAHAGVTHLYIADNRLTIEGLSSLVKSSSLHVLDAGTVDTTRLFHRSALSSSTLPSDLQIPRFGLPGAEKLTPVLAKHSRENLTSLRINHTIVTKRATLKAEQPGPEPEIFELSSDSARNELETPAPSYELPDDQAVRFELAGDPVHFVLSPAIGPKPEDEQPVNRRQTHRTSIYAPEVAVDPEEAEEDEVPVLTATGLSPDAQSMNGVRSPKMECLSADDSRTARSRSPSPHLSLSIISRERQEMRSAQYSEPHGLLPSMLPRLRSLTLTDVPGYDENGQVIDALIQFIRYCAAEAELARLQVEVEARAWVSSQFHYPKPTSQAIRDIFALRRIILEISPTTVLSPSSSVFPNSPISPQTPKSTFRTLSSTGDADSEAFWAAQENDFSFFDDNEECGLPSIEPGTQMPLSSLSEKMTVISDDTPTSASQRPQQPKTEAVARDVVQELIRFRKDRKAAYEDAVRLGRRRTVEGYWPGEVKVVRRQGGRNATRVDFYGNLFEKGYIYR
ncbi:MAG: hypothetical protein Q9203_005285 [Teloschistes exilis]